MFSAAAPRLARSKLLVARFRDPRCGITAEAANVDSALSARRQAASTGNKDGPGLELVHLRGFHGRRRSDHIAEFLQAGAVTRAVANADVERHIVGQSDARDLRTETVLEAFEPSSHHVGYSV